LPLVTVGLKMEQALVYSPRGPLRATKHEPAGYHSG